jgi:uncharacterized protein DUF6624
MNNQLRDELLTRMEREQNLRKELIDNPDDIQLLMRMMEADAQNTMWLDEIIKQHGWLTNSLVGEDGAQAAFLIVQHSPAPQFQKKCLELLEKAVSQNEADMINLAYLTDRIRTFEGKPQVYGTQGQTNSDGFIIPFPIEDEEHVDERRTSIGLEPIAEYFKSMNKSYKTGTK